MEINQDITAQVQAEAALRTLNLELEQRVRTRTAELQRANNDLRQMAYVAAHDLQEPARMVTIYLQKITRCLPDQQDPELLEALCYAAEGGRRMTAQLNDLLKYLEIDERGEEQSLADCEQVLRKTLATLQPLANACGR
ncbi:MAG TPA: hypothetical protein VNN62_07695 [Methylomirabilota bacterium]|jgi:light-regulated signal transduction histidine kinase (bacteriophytochrome)|nr:hypothetical protein [Methylomirabilota bacterium]